MASKARTTQLYRRAIALAESTKLSSSTTTRQLYHQSRTPSQAQIISRQQKICSKHLTSASTPQLKSFSTSTPLTFAKQSSTLPKMAKEDEFILTLSCSDRPGIVHAVTGFLAQHNQNIVDSQQFGDPTSKKFFMRVHFAPADIAAGNKMSVEELKTSFEQTAQSMAMDYELTSLGKKPRVMIMVSKIGHCLNDLLFRQSISQLGIEVPLIVSNHPDFEPLAATYKIPFHHLPVTAATKVEQETRILELVKENNIDLIVLARYMQVLSPTLCTAMSGKIINIHHSFLPSFKGAKPYHQAYDRGVKIIGATAHFVTSDLDEGPIIEQNVVRVGHALSPKELTLEGSNVESNVLATAVKWVTERRVLLNGHKTVVFN
ncbi:hypothetical protein BP6252_00567 [Coleophoma cylindrospora]|uniref:ACT domain-containing protein n=1 Tax=Coleophoma cylindrospora TaxID=1849047 RepID=A0A3D8SQE5_9HELO|nr:hypothetical protein BP6252_00567 [Coleophoma cylindrospora]